MTLHSLLPGLTELQANNLGNESIRIAVLDGWVETEHSCFQGAHLERKLGLCTAGSSSAAMSEHGTHVASLIFGQPNTSFQGVAPGCTGILIPVFCDARGKLYQHDLARAIDQALDAGAHLINLSGGQWHDTPSAEPLLQQALERVHERGALLIAAAGNDGCECLHVPAALPNVLAVGAMDHHGSPMDFSNFWEGYAPQGILAPGENVPGALPGDLIGERSGTSFATPLVTGIVALLMSRFGCSASAARAALLSSAEPCAGDPKRCLRGKLNIRGAMRAMSTDSIQASCSCPPKAAGTPPVPEPTNNPGDFVYVLGTLGYDFGSEARRDSFKQLMPAVSVDDTVVPSNPYDARQMVDYLEMHLSESKALIWTLNLELTPIYAIEPVGPFARDVYGLMRDLLDGQVQGETETAYVERVSIPGRLTDRSVKLFSGQVVPIVEVQHTRGLYGWQVNTLVGAAISAVRTHSSQGTSSEDDIRRSLRGFLQRVYYDLRNLGHTSRDRALNFAATNAFQAAHTFAEAIAQDMELDSIDVERSPFCRLDSDCWDVKLKFFDPENNRRAKRVFRFTIDVSDILPVTLGEVRSWSSPD